MRGVQKVHSLTQLTTRYAFLLSSDPVVVLVVQIGTDNATCRVGNVLVVRQFCVFSWILSD